MSAVFHQSCDASPTNDKLLKLDLYVECAAGLCLIKQKGPGQNKTLELGVALWLPNTPSFTSLENNFKKSPFHTFDQNPPLRPPLFQTHLLQYNVLPMTDLNTTVFFCFYVNK